MADEIAGWVREPVHVVGLSMGGMVAQHLAVNHPALVRSLVLACTTDRTPTDILLARADATESAPREDTVDSTVERWFTPEALAATPAPPPIEYARSCLSAIDLHAFAAVWRALAGHDLSGRLATITTPTTCLAAAQDVSTPPDELARMARRMPNARYVEIAGPHMTFLEDPAGFSAAVIEHLNWATSS